MGKIKLLKGNNSISIDRITINENFEHLHTDVDTIQSTITNKNIETVSNKVTNQSTVLGTTVTDALESLKNTVLIPGATGVAGATGADSTVQGPAGATGAAGATGSVGATGTSSANTIYTADGTLTGNRTVDLDGNDLNFNNGSDSLYKMTDNGGHIFDGDGTANNVFSFRKGGSSLFSLGSSINGFSNQSTVNFANGSLGSNDRIEISLSNDNQMGWYNNAGTQGHRIRYGSYNHVAFFMDGVFGWRGFTVGGDNRISTEDISLQGSTLIKGQGTSTGSTLALYNSDTTPVKTWDFLDNGNVNLGVDSVVGIGANDLDINGTGLFSVSNGAKSISTSWNTHTTFNLDNGSGTTYSLYNGNASTTFNAGEFGIGVGSNIPFRIFNTSGIALGGVPKGSLDTNYNVQTNGSALIGGSLDTKLGTNEISLDHNNYPKLKISNGTNEYWLIEGDGTGSVFTNGDLYFYDNTNSRKLLQFKANGTINVPNLPTSATGLSSDDLWNENGVVRIGTSGGGGGGNTIYTADDSLVDNRTINLNGKNLTFQKLSSTTQYTKVYRNGGLEVRGSGFDGGDDVFKVKYRVSGNDLLAVGQNGGVTIDSFISMGQFNATWNYGQRFTDGYISFLNGSTWNDNEVIRFDLRNNSDPTLTFNRNGQGTAGNRFIVRSSVLAETNYGTSKEQISLQGNTLIKGDTGTERTSYNFKVANSSLEPSFMVFNNKDVIIGASTKVSTEKVSLQGSTLIKGDGTSTGSTLVLYNNDTTPVKTWDFLDDGEVISETGALAIGLSSNPYNSKLHVKGQVILQAESTGYIGGWATTSGANITAVYGNGDIVLGGYALIGTEKISLQGDTLLNANVNIPNLPTASTGLSSGDLWNDSGVVRVGTTVSNFLEKNTGTTYNTNNLMTVTQAEYDALTPDANTIYFIV